MHPLLIIGAGPAGLSAAIYAARGGRAPLVLDTGASALRNADKIENYFGFEQPLSGEALLAQGKAQALRLGVSIQEAEVVGMSYDGTQYEVKTTSETYTAACVILASGSSRKAPRIKGLTDFEGRGVSYCAVCDAFFYRGKHVAVLGGGAYALEEVQTLLPVAEAVTVLTNGQVPEVEFPEAVTVETRPIAAITGGDTVSTLQFAEGDPLAVDGIFIAYGSAGSTDIARVLGAMLDGNAIRVDATMQTNLPGLFAAGDCTGGLLQVSKAVSDGAIAGLEAIKFLRRTKA